MKKNKGANIIVRNIPCNFINIKSINHQWKANIEFDKYTVVLKLLETSC